MRSKRVIPIIPVHQEVYPDNDIEDTKAWEEFVATIDYDRVNNALKNHVFEGYEKEDNKNDS